MNKELLRTGDTDSLTFKFMYNSEYLKPESRFLLREGRTKILGRVTKIYTNRESIKKIETEAKNSKS